MATNMEKVRAATEEDLESQIASLRKELSSITQSLSEQGYEIGDQAATAYDAVKRSGRKAVKYVGEEAHFVADKARENPLTAVAIVSAVAAIGLLAGLSAYRR
ncbi:hypothetical protein M8997_005350 [Phyllobacterium sp. 21LDTY02-6]|jgi:ElaB/YqjD/DUF883 family membrane-anchored ribosome-binding protein|uniref:hypothetical protein n=1 Tax=unclassified Phyllobacterium TaxID=2638441 RepID=UPI0020217D74|nr:MULTISPECIES: hypothetical protein [unclassified Phyllobacterium]MCO4316601.1 hypothetical protein [Phyllobacterium sp. 21LDTY02-6]MCX8282249.1 hypothetical protein [Phyllobacterium sp. 0TCS1.6C]MCX8294937.1 hypothetical protein [Phyllobacterium sp. 0TCS1.6A]